MFRLERSQLQTGNKRDNPYEKLTKPLRARLKGFRTFSNIQWSPKATRNTNFLNIREFQFYHSFYPYFRVKIILKKESDKLGCITF